MEEKIIRVFDKDYLTQLLEKDKAILLNEYKKLNGGTLIYFKCNCGNESSKLFRDISYYAGAFCKECNIKNKSNKIKNTCIKKYGVSNVSFVKEIHEKKEKTYMEHYGMHPTKTKEVRDKYIETCIKKYNCINSGQIKEVKEKIKNTFNEKYGGHPMYNEEIKEKVKTTCIEKYGGHQMYNEEIKEKVKNTCFEKYGGYPMQSDNVKEKVKITCLEKYGCHPSQTIEVMQKTQEKAKKYKKYTLPSGKIINVQGYEPFALDELLKIYKEEEIITERSLVPRIEYIYNEKIKYYFPDIYIPSINKIIEIKSTWTYTITPEIREAKKNGTIAKGYVYEIWVFDNKRNKTIY
jgi:hypothetical protein